MSDLIDYSKVLKVYKDELMGLYDKDALDEVLSVFHARFKWYAEVIFKRTRKVQKAYYTWELQCEEALKLNDCRQKMIVIDRLINMAHKGGFFGGKLIKDFDTFKKKLKELEK